MPALSPTMTEGNIANWKVKEGDSFVVGDVILEIETDKASMDVEAQDDGVMAKIIQPNGTKSVQVGTRIAVLAEEGDDLASLEIPPEDSKTASKIEQQPSQADSSTKESQSNTSDPPASTSKPSTPPPSQAGQISKYPLYPSVSALLHEKHIPDSEIAKIPATGPSGRLLKGDVLAYLGSIESSYSSTQSKRIQKLSHLDLSNVKPAPSPAPAQPSATAAAPTPPPPPPTTVSISLPISLTQVLTLQKRLQDTLGSSIPLSTILARATDLANDDLPRTKASLSSPAELFNAVVGLESLNPRTSPGTYIPDILPSSTSALAPQARKPKRRPEPDIIDILSGKVSANAQRSTPKPIPQAPSPPASAPAQATNIFSLTVPKGEEMRARTFLERMKTVLQVEPGRLVL
ncbi:MAG: hypothetical protein Q9160_007283 [Pyrenula sp. 1 TL-2023]